MNISSLNPLRGNISFEKIRFYSKDSASSRSFSYVSNLAESGYNTTSIGDFTINHASCNYTSYSSTDTLYFYGGQVDFDGLVSNISGSGQLILHGFAFGVRDTYTSGANPFCKVSINDGVVSSITCSSVYYEKSATLGMACNSISISY